MDTRRLAYLGGGVLVAIVVMTLLRVPPLVWIVAALVVGVVGVFVVARQIQADGSGIAARMVGLSGPAAPKASSAEPTDATPAPSSTDGRPVDVEQVRAPGDDGTTAVWLHRCGGRRVHRFATPQGWTVQQVSTKDPNNPKKRVIGDELSFANETDAVRAADDLARGKGPKTTRAGVLLGKQAMSTAEV